jgi:hypothetical protein
LSDVIVRVLRWAGIAVNWPVLLFWMPGLIWVSAMGPILPHHVLADLVPWLPVVLAVTASRDVPSSWPFGALLFPDDTVFAPRFTESNFVRIRKGMSVEQVETLVGQPLRVTEVSGYTTRREHRGEGSRRMRVEHRRPGEAAKGFVYEYSRAGPLHDNYFIRRVILRSGDVERVIVDFYSD